MTTSDEVLAEAVRAVFREHPTIEGQGALAGMVNQRLEAQGHQAATPPRIRRVALRSRMVRVQPSYRRGHGAVPEGCPWCAEPIAPARNRTLDGGEVLVGGRCQKCGYTTGRLRQDAALLVFQRTGRIHDQGSNIQRTNAA